MWQDWVFSVGGFVILVSLIPTLRARQKPALATSVMTTVLVGIFAATMATLELWLSAVANGLIAVAWGVLAYQKYSMDQRRRRRRVPVTRVPPPAVEAVEASEP